MARKPEQANVDRNDSNHRTKIVEAFMALLAERSFEEIGFGDIAARAGLSLVQCRDVFASTFGVLAAHAKMIDRKVLAGGDGDLADELPRERLFDVLMRRLEALAPDRPAIRSLLASAKRNPPLAFALNTLNVRSQQWMLAAADIDGVGPAGMVRAQGLALLYASVLRTWVDDDDPGLARTMASLDRALARGGRCAELLEGASRLLPSALCPGGRRSWRPRRETDLDEEPIPA